MVEARVEHRLAAILAADVAGYSRLMGVKTTGDGMLVKFASVAKQMLIVRLHAEFKKFIPGGDPSLGHLHIVELDAFSHAFGSRC
jgi:hypothetical protein